ncbi:hypothetical protein GCM10007108_01040 [Thermogymnomonas acidicola]|uniref:Uncharacterized protein n=1 Tax=Thermogymnomonas acidicola TaxID=399579 RepID=A0AA37F8L6_9ARCH|nr:hypothetical protein [Thermogymnomonas acidicola]GGM66649.1 hypothetical protein GCM10007108_01040 [Thermogymnomonas acidicola]
MAMTTVQKLVMVLVGIILVIVGAYIGWVDFFVPVGHLVAGRVDYLIVFFVLVLIGIILLAVVGGTFRRREQKQN